LAASVVVISCLELEPKIAEDEKLIPAEAYRRVPIDLVKLQGELERPWTSFSATVSVKKFLEKSDHASLQQLAVLVSFHAKPGFHLSIGSSLEETRQLEALLGTLIRGNTETAQLAIQVLDALNPYTAHQ
jgi:hypothetical protein